MRFDVCLGLPFVIQWSLCVYRRMYPPMSCLQFKEKLERIWYNGQQTENVKLILRLCCKMSWKALLRFLPAPTKKNFARQVRKWVVKRSRSLINSFCRNVANQVPHFFLALYRDRKSHCVAHFLLLRILIFAILVVSFPNHKNS